VESEKVKYIFEDLEIFADSIALVEESGNKICYSELVFHSSFFAQVVGKRTIVFIMCRNCMETVVAYVSCLRNRLVPVLISDSIDQILLENLLESYRPEFFFLPSEQVGESIFGSTVKVFGKYSLVKLKFTQDYELSSDLAVLMTTSGSTGSPKLVRLSYKNLSSNTKSIIEYLKITNKDRAITTMPMNYTYGLSIVTSHLQAGASVILSEASLMEKRFWELLETYKATTFGGVPYTFEILKRLHFERMELPFLNYITQAGGKLSKELVMEFVNICKSRNKKFIVMYGQTEASPRMAYLPWEYAQEKCGSIGRAIPGGKFSLVDTEGKEIMSSETVGELVYTGDNVALGYTENRFDLNRLNDFKSVLHTGDMAKRDEDGFYYIVGRKKRFLKIYGNRINLDELEILLHKESIDCACSGDDDNLVVYVTNKDDKEKSFNFILNHTGINRNGFKVLLIDKIPRNESGKILYSELKND
jgi:acyl-coenzyme A synthetase/AMP-(fatty) acid ligase